jgi:hypothetical protein
MPADLPAIAEKIRLMRPEDQLRLAASLLERNKYDLAATIAQNVVDHIKWAKLVGGKA